MTHKISTRLQIAAATPRITGATDGAHPLLHAVLLAVLAALATLPISTLAKQLDDQVSARREPGGPATLTLIAQAYTAYQKGDWKLATAHYDELLAERPEHRDALLGRAQLYLRTSQRTQAKRLYQRMLAIDPSDIEAQIGLQAAAATHAWPQRRAQLNSQLQQDSGSPTRNYALARGLLRERRWAEARQALLTALAGAPENADIAYNLAICLDHLGHHHQALHYYRQSLAAMAESASSFDVVPLRTRLTSLQRYLDAATPTAAPPQDDD